MVSRIRTSRAQSTVLGTVLLLGIVVLAVGVVSVGAIFPAVAGSGEPVADVDVTVTTDAVRLTHVAGDGFAASALRVYLYPGATGGVAFEDSYPDSRFEATDTWEYGVSYSRGEEVRVALVHEPSNTFVTEAYATVGRPESITGKFDYSPSDPDTDETVTFDASDSFHPEGSITSYAWEFGDGTTATGETATHSYGDDGSYDVTLTVTGDGGATDTTTKAVFVDNRRPSATFSYSPTAPASGESVSFDASSSSDPDGSVASYAWEFGDGTTATGKTTSHSYGTDGTYEVNLTVTDDDGLSNVTTKTVSVGSVPQPGVAFRRASNTELQTVDTSGLIGRYSAGKPQSVGPMTHDLDGDGNKEVPYIDQNGDIRAIDLNNQSTLLFDTSAYSYDLKTSGTRIAVGDWSGDGTPSVFAPNGNSKLVRANTTGVSRVVTQPEKTNPNGKVTRSAKYLDAAAAAGITDLDADGTTDIVLVTTNGDLAYTVEQNNGNLKVTKTGVKLNTFRAVGSPGDFDGDGTAEVPYYDGTVFGYAGSGGQEGTFTGASPQATGLGTWDRTGGATPEVVYIDGNGDLRYVTAGTNLNDYVTDENGNTISADTGPNVA